MGTLKAQFSSAGCKRGQRFKAPGRHSISNHCLPQHPGIPGLMNGDAKEALKLYKNCWVALGLKILH